MPSKAKTQGTRYVDGLPIYWLRGKNHALQDAIRAFLAYRLDKKRSLSNRQFKLARDYFEYYFSAPGWSTGVGEEEQAIYAEMREQIGKIENVEALSAWLLKSIEIFCIDPL